MAAAYVGHADATYAEGTSREITKATLEAAGAASGHLLCVHVYLERTGKTISVEGGAEISPEQKETAGIRSAAFWILWNGTSAVKVTWTGSEKSGTVVSVDIWKETATSSPIDSASAWVTWAAATKATSPTYTITAAGCQQVIMQTNNTGQTFKAAPAGFTARNNVSGNSPNTVSREKTGSTGTTEFELSASCSGLGFSYAIKPVEEATTPRFLNLLGVGQ